MVDCSWTVLEGLCFLSTRKQIIEVYQSVLDQQCGASDTENPGITQVPTWIFLGRYLPE
jgi:hypothetical protein